MVGGGGGGQGKGEGWKKEKNKCINHAYKTFRVALCECFAEDVDLNLRGWGGSVCSRGAGEREVEREGENNKRKDGNMANVHKFRNLDL